MSGTTTRVPVNTVLSPALALSTISPLRITSTDLGIDPEGISLEGSCILTFYQSMKVLSVWFNSHLVLFSQVSTLQRTGSVYLNCCSILVYDELQISHLKVPIKSSGFTSVVLVTVPVIAMS